jgi:hypothetical protein
MTCQLPLFRLRALIVTLWSAAFFLVPLHFVTAAPRTPTSEFTSTDMKKAKVLESGESGGTFLCPGLGGYRVLLQVGDDRSYVGLLHGNTEIHLAIDIFQQCPGVRPWKANNVVQWRGYRSGNQFHPYAIIFRMYSESRNLKKPFDTLVVVKLEGSRSRVVGSVPGSAGNVAAENLADRLCQP